MAFRGNAVVPCLYMVRNAGSTGCTLGKRFHLRTIPDDREDDLEQLMRDV